jgi:hypothetical protein
MKRIEVEQARISAHFTVEDEEQIKHDARTSGIRLVNDGTENGPNR